MPKVYGNCRLAELERRLELPLPASEWVRASHVGYIARQGALGWRGESARRRIEEYHVTDRLPIT